MAIGLVVLIVAFVPDDLAVALEGEDVRGDPIQEPPVVADDDGATGKVEQRLFEGTQRVDVEVVGGLVEQQQVGPLRSSLAMWTRLRSPPESWPTSFCWSRPLKLNHET